MDLDLPARLAWIAGGPSPREPEDAAMDEGAELGALLARLSGAATQDRSARLLLAVLRDALAWRLRAELLELAQASTSSDAFMRGAVELVADRLGAGRAVFWVYDPDEDALDPRWVAGAAPTAPLPAALFREAADAREPRTAAMPRPDGTLETWLLGPVYEDGRLVGVFQLEPGDATLDPAVEAALGAVTTAVSAGLRTTRAFERLSFQASHDPLTGLANRRTFEAFLERELKLAERHGTTLSVLVIDVDHFKRFNDTHGHLAGDALLRALGARLPQVVRSTDFVARYGGEEFVVVLPHTDKAGAVFAATKILDGIRGLHERAALPGGPITASIGVATYPSDVFDPRELFNAADQAMYAAKRDGRDRVRLAG